MSPYRLRRLDWIFDGRPIYFITACTLGRRPRLANVEVHQALGEFCRRAAQRGVYVGRYVPMTDHLHLFAVLAPNAPSLAICMKSLKNTVSKILRCRGDQSPHWQKGHFDHGLRSQESDAQKWAYVQQNPMRAGLASRAEEWSSQGEIFPLEIQL